MTIQNIALFKGLAAKMDYLNQRQAIVSQNVANADTPGYVPKDLEPVDFRNLLRKSTGENVVRTEATQPGHISDTTNLADPQSGAQKKVYEVAPSGNAVVLEEQMITSSQITLDYNLLSTLLQRNVGLIRTALGVGA
jgi:flagellar basal-body rod protein FlgB